MGLTVVLRASCRPRGGKKRVGKGGGAAAGANGGKMAAAAWAAQRRVPGLTNISRRGPSGERCTALCGAVRPWRQGRRLRPGTADDGARASALVDELVGL